MDEHVYGLGDLNAERAGASPPDPEPTLEEEAGGLMGDLLDTVAGLVEQQGPDGRWGLLQQVLNGADFLLNNPPIPGDKGRLRIHCWGECPSDRRGHAFIHPHTVLSVICEGEGAGDSIFLSVRCDDCGHTKMVPAVISAG